MTLTRTKVHNGEVWIEILQLLLILKHKSHLQEMNSAAENKKVGVWLGRPTNCSVNDTHPPATSAHFVQIHLPCRPMSVLGYYLFAYGSLFRLFGLFRGIIV